MPMYEFKCSKCEHITERICRIDDFPIVRCEMCWQPAPRIVSKSTFRLKGSGWYKDGYNKKPE